MDKFLYIQDFHITGNNSKFYMGNYFEDSLIMLDEILAIAKHKQVDAIIDGGDLLDAAEPAYRIIDEIVDRVEKVKIPIYSLFGNHAERYHSMKHSRYTGMAHMQKRSKYFKYLGQDLGYKKINIKGYEYSHNIEEELKQDGIIVEGNKDTWKIAVVHAFVTPKEFPYAAHVIAKDIKTNADVVLVAHYHAEWEQKIGETMFKDIGCLGRRSITEKDIKPKVLFIDAEERAITTINLKSAKEAKDCFNLKVLDEQNILKEDLDKFIKSIESMEFQGTDLEAVVRKCGIDNNFEQAPIDLLIQKIKEQKEE